MREPKIAVIGSSNIDLISYAPRLPKLGETVGGSRFLMGFGGKGANQAVMAAKLGGVVTMITKVGDDIFGRDYLENYRKLNFDTRYVLVTSTASTGVAPIWVDEPSGNNAIIVVAGANDLLSPADVESARPALEGADVIVAQWECPLATTLAALAIGRAAGVPTLFNAAPARGTLPPEAYRLSTILCVNESETEALTGQSVATLEEARAAAQTLLSRGTEQVLLTLGERGSLWVTATQSHYAPGVAVEAVDTTGAGDAFVGSVAYFLGIGQSMALAMEHANQVAALSVQQSGTQSSFPERSALPSTFFRSAQS